MAIHPTAIVDAAAEVDPSAEIGPFSLIGARVVIGAKAVIKNHVTVFGRSTIGEGTVVWPGAVIGGDPQFLAFKGEDSEVVIGKGCHIHEYVTVNKGTARGGMVTKVGDRCMIMAYAHVAHDVHIENDVVIGNNTQLAGHVRVGRKAIISGMTGVHHFVTVGELAFIGAMSGLRMDVPPFMMYDGVPAEPRNVNVVGLRRDGWDESDVQAVKAAYKALFHDRSGQTLGELLDAVPAMSFGTCPKVVHLVEWLREHLENNRKGRVQEGYR